MTGEEFKQRFLPLGGKLYGVALRLMCNAQEAEDVVQDAYLKLWAKRDGLPGMDNAEAYCIALAKNICYDRLRSKCLTRDDCPTEHVDAASPTDIEAEVETRDNAGIMRRCIECLPEQQRLIITMRDVNGLGYDEIERATGLNAVNIRVTLSRARKTLREQFNTIKNYGNQ